LKNLKVVCIFHKEIQRFVEYGMPEYYSDRLNTKLVAGIQMGRVSGCGIVVSFAMASEYWTGYLNGTPNHVTGLFQYSKGISTVMIRYPDKFGYRSAIQPVTGHTIGIRYPDPDIGPYIVATVSIRIPNRPVFEWSLFGRLFCPVFKWSVILFWPPFC
jgi:hypothetical protein